MWIPDRGCVQSNRVKEALDLWVVFGGDLDRACTAILACTQSFGAEPEVGTSRCSQPSSFHDENSLVVTHASLHCNFSAHEAV
jgi:hypothetical protein